MATIKFGAIVTDMRGKLGGHVFQKGNQSRVMKTRGTPPKAISSVKLRQSDYLKQVRDYWRTFTQNGRVQWGKTAKDFPVKNRFGDNIVLNGYQFYVKHAMAYKRAGFALPLNVSDLTTVRSSAYLVSSNISISSGTLSILLSGTVAPSRFSILANKVRYDSSAVRRSDFRWFAQFNNSVPSNTGLYGSMENVIGPITGNEVIYIGVVLTNPFGLTNDISYVKATFI